MNSQNTQEPRGWTLDQMTPSQLASMERIQSQLIAAGWEYAGPAPPWRNRSAMSPELHAEYDANPTWCMDVGWYMSREYVEIRLRLREVGGDPAKGRGLVWRAYPTRDVEPVIEALIALQDNLDEHSWRTISTSLKPLSAPLLFEVPGGFLVT